MNRNWIIKCIFYFYFFIFIIIYCDVRIIDYGNSQYIDSTDFKPGNYLDHLPKYIYDKIKGPTAANAVLTENMNTPINDMGKNIKETCKKSSWDCEKISDSVKLIEYCPYNNKDKSNIFDVISLNPRRNVENSDKFWED